MCVYHYLFDGAAGGAEGAAHETMRALLGMGAAVWHKDLQARPRVVMLGVASTRSERSVGVCTVPVQSSHCVYMEAEAWI